ncbi:MAG: hypothetical protein AAF266_14655 [Planctomycetota bacterium]
MTRDEGFRRPHLFAIAGSFALFCGLSSLRYIWFNFAGGPVVAAWTQFLCYALTAGSVAFFFQPRIGYFGMLAVAFLVLLREAPAGPSTAVVFWFGVLVLLLLPRLVPPSGDRCPT